MQAAQRTEPRLSGLGAREVQADSCGCSDGDTQAELPGAENTPDPAWRDGSRGGQGELPGVWDSVGRSCCMLYYFQRQLVPFLLGVVAKLPFPSFLPAQCSHGTEFWPMEYEQNDSW